MYVDGAKNNLSVGVGVVLKSPEGAVFEHCLKLNFTTTNNEAKYKAFTAVRSASKLLVLELHIFSDSKLVVNQVTKSLKPREPKCINIRS